LLLQSKITIQNKLSAFNNTLNKSKAQYFAVDPDGLYKNLKDIKVKFMIVGSLRLNPAIADGNIINTYQNYMEYVQLKYPKAFKPIRQFGNINNEPCLIYEVLY
jgi:hypothetical protein